jgi:hypothetical protein
MRRFWSAWPGNHLMVEASAQSRLRSNWSPVSLLLIALMAFGSVLMWIGVPVGLVYLASRLADSPTPSMGPYLLILIGLPVGMVAVGKVLGALDRYHGRITGLDDGKPQQAAWMKSMRGERERKRPRSVLDTVMIISVAVALVLSAVWFFGFAGSSLPGS